MSRRPPKINKTALSGPWLLLLSCLLLVSNLGAFFRLSQVLEPQNIMLLPLNDAAEITTVPEYLLFSTTVGPHTTSSGLCEATRHPQSRIIIPLRATATAGSSAGLHVGRVSYTNMPIAVTNTASTAVFTTATPTGEDAITVSPPSSSESTSHVEEQVSSPPSYSWNLNGGEMIQATQQIVERGIHPRIGGASQVHGRSQDINGGNSGQINNNRLNPATLALLALVSDHFRLFVWNLRNGNCAMHAHIFADVFAHTEDPNVPTWHTLDTAPTHQEYVIYQNEGYRVFRLEQQYLRVNPTVINPAEHMSTTGNRDITDQDVVNNMPAKHMRGVFPTEIWIQILEELFLHPRRLRPHRQSKHPRKLILLDKNNVRIDLVLLCHVTQVSQEMRNLALEMFFARNRFHFSSGDRHKSKEHSGWMWLQGIPNDWIQFLRDIRLSFDCRAGSSGIRARSVRNLVKLLGRSRFLKHLALDVDVIGLSSSQLLNFRDVPIFKLLSHFRNIEHLTIEASDGIPFAELEQWLQNAMTQQIPRGLNGGHFLPCVWTNLPSLTTRLPWNNEEYELWAQALGIDRIAHGISETQILRRARAFKKEHTIKRAARRSQPALTLDQAASDNSGNGPSQLEQLPGKRNLDDGSEDEASQKRPKHT